LVINSAKLMTSTEAMLLDSGYIQELEAEWRNRKAERRGKKPYPHLYTAADAISCLQSFQSVSYGEDVQLDEQVRVRLLEYSLISRIFLVTVIRRTKGRQMCRGRRREMHGDLLSLREFAK
jgi:metallo-beta-lactamase family protein